MAYRKPPNLNTKYGRRRARQEAMERYNNLSPSEKADRDTWGCIITLIILVVVGGLIFLISGPEAFFKWLTR